MKANKKKIIVLCGMVLLLVVTGVLNFYLNSNSTPDPVDDGATVATYFSSFRADREVTRQEMFSYLDTIIKSDASSADAKAAAEDQQLELCAKMEIELAVENLIKAKGFTESAVSMSGSKIYVVVPTEDALSGDQVAQIVSVITGATDYLAKDIIIIPYN